MSWLRLELVSYKVGGELDLDTRCTIEHALLSGSDNVILVISGPDTASWDGCPDCYHDANGEPQPMALATPTWHGRIPAEAP